MPAKNKSKTSERYQVLPDLNEQNINLHRQEMADRWRLQEMINKNIQENIATLVSAQGTHVNRMHKLEKGIIYATIANVAAAAVAVGSRFVP